MPKHNVFLALPDELYAEAIAAARLRRITLSDLLVQALSETLESEQRVGWAAERAPLGREGTLYPH